ncbi:MAG: Gfo/Idh/MocA family oxidoreductase [Cytophagales bacterium]|nr:Gfo/Idh/MocA family oxidoreductase [Cytophagales bacterium]
MKPVGPEQIQDTHEHDHVSQCVSNLKKYKQMKNTDQRYGRRTFLKTSAITGWGIGLSGVALPTYGKADHRSLKVGIIGLDTSHSIAFTKKLNDPEAGSRYSGYKVVAAYPKGSSEIATSTSRIPGYTSEIQKYGVRIVDSIDDLLAGVDVVLLETNDGRLHLEQALPVLKSGKRMFIDKPLAASLTDAIAIFKASRKYGVPIFSCSSLRYISGMDEVTSGEIGEVIGAETYSPAKLEKTHPDLFWYGIHGVETLFTAMGTGCKRVLRFSNEDTDVVVGFWDNKRIGTFRGIRRGRASYGGTIYGARGIKVLGSHTGYDPLLERIVEYFKSGIPPVSAEETLEILAFMEAAEVSKKKEVTVDLESVMKKAEQKASKLSI